MHRVFFLKKTYASALTLRLVCDKVGAQSKVSHGFNLSVFECPCASCVVWGGTFVASGRLTESTVYRKHALHVWYIMQMITHGEANLNLTTVNQSAFHLENR